MNLIETVAGDNYTLRLWSNREVPTTAIKKLVKGAANFFVWQFQVDARNLDYHWYINFEWRSPNRRICLEHRVGVEELFQYSELIPERIARELRIANQQHNPPQLSAIEKAATAAGMFVEDFRQRVETASSVIQRQEMWRTMRRFFGERQVEIPNSFESLRQGFEAIASTPLVAASEAGELLANVFKPKAIGDISCKFNAQSPHLRCTPNPCGPCEGCRHYES